MKSMERRASIESVDRKGEGEEDKDVAEEEVMSEVHIGCPPGVSGRFISHFTISAPTEVATRDCVGDGSQEHGTVNVDEDGDLILTRRRKPCRHCFTLTIKHSITSSIPRVGLQVWKAELVLSDFVSHMMTTSSKLDGITAVELGGGTGMVGMLVARVAGKVFLTDCGDDILENCLENVHLNHKVLNYMAAVCVRELDWMKPWPPPVNAMNNSSEKRYSWSCSEVEEAESASLLLAADVIYSDDLTDALFNTLKNLMSQGTEKVLYLGLEKRYNFSLSDMDVVANSYSHFRDFVRVEGESDKLGEEQCFVGKCIDLSQIPQCIHSYDRGNDVELWEIKYIRGKPSKTSMKS